MQNPQRSFSGRRTTGTKTDTLPRTVRSWIFLIIMRAHPASKLGEGATAVTGAELCERLFQSTPPARGATSCLAAARSVSLHFNPRPPRGGRHYGGIRHLYGGHFNPRPPRGGRLTEEAVWYTPDGFQSTPPARGATMGLATTSMAGTLFQSTPPARGATVNGQLLVQIPFISIHAPREGGDGLCAALGVPFVEFQSTPPARGATVP